MTSGNSKTSKDRDLIEKRIRKIKNACENFKKEYKYLKKPDRNYKAVEDFIDFLGNLEEVFLRAQMENWDEDKVGNCLAKQKVNFLKSERDQNSDVLGMVYDDFQSLFQCDGNPYEDTEKLLAHYRGCEECTNFIIYLRDVYSLLRNLLKRKIDQEAVKQKLCRLEIKELPKKENFKTNDFERISREFGKLVA